MNTNLPISVVGNPQSGFSYYFVKVIKYCFALSILLSSLTAYSQDRPFITIWKSDNEGETEDNQVKFPGHGTDYTIDWEKVDDPSINGSETATDTHTITFPEAGTYRLSVSGDFHRISFPAEWQLSDAPKLLDVEQWGDIAWSSMEGAFRGCSNMTASATDTPDLSNVTSMRSMFVNAISFNSPINHWDVSNVTDMRGMFSGASSFNSSIGHWDVSNVSNMTGMFSGASSFNQPLNNWDVFNVTDMSWMFDGTSSFNQPLENWDVSKVTNMRYMFFVARSFNQSLNNWDVSNVTSMERMFNAAASFNQPLDNWDVSNVSNMALMLNNSNLSAYNYDQSLQGWAALETLQKDVNMGAQGLTYCLATSARQKLIEEHGWTITDDVQNCDSGAFISIWDSSVEGSENPNEINIPFYGEGATVLWRRYESEGDFEVYTVEGFITKLELEAPGEYQVNIFAESGSFTSSYDTEMLKLREIKQWGAIEWISLSQAFTATHGLSITASDQPNLENLMAFNFFPGSISGMFLDAKAFNSDISHWDVSAVTDMSEMFYGADSFNIDLSSWDVGNVTRMISMFHDAVSFNQPLASWDVSNVENMDGMFSGATSFDQSLENWNVSNVESMNRMFSGAASFDQPLGSWDVSNVKIMSAMFREAISFNQTLEDWDVSQVFDMDGMFSGASSFDQSLGDWNIASVENMFSMLDSTNLSIENYDATLSGWASSATTPANVILGAAGLLFCESLEDRQKLIDELGWSIIGDKRCLYTVAFFPEEDATLVAFDTDLSISFNQPIEAKDLSLISMEDFEGNAIAITNPQIEDNSIVFKAASELSYHSYRVHIPAATIESEWGVANEEIVWEFSTQRVLSNEAELQTQRHYNVPNPFSEQTQLYFSLSSPQEVVLMVTDLQGRVVEHTALGMLDAGEQSYTFQATGLPAGLYSYHIITLDERLSGKMMVKK